MFWSPTGQFIVLCALRSTNYQLEFVDTSDFTITNTQEHFKLTDVEWDPTGRYVVTSVSYWTNKVCFVLQPHLNSNKNSPTERQCILDLVVPGPVYQKVSRRTAVSILVAPSARHPSPRRTDQGDSKKSQKICQRFRC